MDKLCKQCKLKKKVKKLEAELAELKTLVDGHMGHYIYPYPYTYSYPLSGYGAAGGGNFVNPITWTSGMNYDSTSGNGGASSEG